MPILVFRPDFYRLLIRVFLWTCPSLLIGQSIVPTPVQAEFDTAYGAPTDEIYRIAVDGDGLVWMATELGLYTFDGVRFTKRGGNLASGSVFNLTLVGDGAVYYTDLYGTVFRYSMADGERVIQESTATEGSHMPQLLHDGNSLFISRALSVFQHDLDTLVLKEYVLTNSYGTYSNLFILNGNPAIIKVNHLFTWEEGRFVDQGMIHALPSDNYVMVSQLGDESVLLIPGAGFLRLDADASTEEISFQGLDTDQIVLFKQVDNHFVICSGTGLYKYGVGDQGKELRLISRELASYFVSDTDIDKQGVRWVSTLRNGIIALPASGVNVVPLPELSAAAITSLVSVGQDKLAIIQGFEKLSLLDLASGKVQSTPIDRATNQVLKYRGEEDALLLQVKGTEFWYDPQTLRLISSKPTVSDKDWDYWPDGSRLNSRFNRIEIERDGNPLFTIPGRASSIRTVSDRAAVAISLQQCILIEKNPNGKFSTRPLRPGIKLDVNKDGQVAVLNNKVISICIDPTATHPVWTDYNLQDNPSELLFVQDRVWLSMPDGIQLFNVDSGDISFLDGTQGLPSRPAASLSNDSQFVYLAYGPTIYQIPLQIEPLKKQRDLQVRSLQVNGIEINTGELQFTGQENQVSLELHVNGLGSMDNAQFETKVANGDWTALPRGSSRISFAELPIGEYDIEARFRQSASASDISLLTIPISVLRPWYKTWWARFIIIGVLVGLMTFVLTWRSRRKASRLEFQAQRLEQERAMVQVQLENLRSQMNPHFVFNAMNTIQEFIVNNKPRDATRFLVKFSRLIRTFLSHSRVELITLQDEVDHLSLYLSLEELRLEGGLDWSFSIQSNVDAHAVSLPSLVVQPYVENAIVHGLANLPQQHPRSLNVGIAVDDGASTLIITVTDNGVGRDRAEQLKSSSHASFATFATEKRLNLLKTSLGSSITVKIEDGDTRNPAAPGTRVTLTIPYTRVR